MPDQSPEPNSYDDFAQRFAELMNEAGKYGIVSTVSLFDDDKLKQETSSDHLYRGPLPTCVGLVVAAKRRYLNRHFAPDE